MANIDTNMVLGFVWAFPVLILILESCFKKKTLIYFIGLGMWLALTCYAAHMHVLMFALILTFIYGMMKWAVSDRKDKWRLFCYSVVSILICLALSFAQLAPFLSFLFESQRGIKTSGPSVWMLPSNFISAFYPVITMIRRIQDILSALMGVRVGIDSFVYLGVIPFVCSFFVFIYAFKRRLAREVYIFLAFFLAYFLYTLLSSIPIVAAIYSKFSLSFIFSRMAMLYVLSGAVLTAWTLHFLFEREEHLLRLLKKFTQLIFWVLICPVTILSIVFTAMFPYIRRWAVDKILPTLTEGGSVFSSAPYSSQYALDRIHVLLNEIYELVWIGSPFMWIPVVVISGLLVVTALFKRASLSRGAILVAYSVIILLMALDAFYYGYKGRPATIHAGTEFGRNASISFLMDQQGLHRFASIQPEPGRMLTGSGRLVFKPNLGTVYGLYDVGGQESLIYRQYNTFAKRALQNQWIADAGSGVVVDFRDLNLKLAGMLNVKYVIQDVRDKRVWERDFMSSKRPMASRFLKMTIICPGPILCLTIALSRIARLS